MGLNTVVMIYNDNLHDIGNHPDEFVQEIIEKSHMGSRHGEPTSLRWGKLLDVLHSSATHILAVGGNTGKVVHRTPEPYHKKEEYIQILREMASAVGYRLIKR